MATGEKRMVLSLIKIFVYRSSQSKVFCGKSVIKSLGKFSGKHHCQSLFLKRDPGTTDDF